MAIPAVRDLVGGGQRVAQDWAVSATVAFLQLVVSRRANFLAVMPPPCSVRVRAVFI